MVQYLSINRIEAHKGLTGNEMADHMAIEEEFMTVIGDSIDTSIGYDKKKLWTVCYSVWTKEWKQETTFRMSKIFYPHPDKSKTTNSNDMVGHTCEE